MKINDCVLEAAEAIGAPGRVSLFLDNFGYNTDSGEWFFEASGCDNPTFLAEMRAMKAWALEICDWLQYKYSEGPIRVQERNA